MTTALIRMPPDTPAPTLVEALQAHGYAVIERLAPELTARAEHELQSYFERAPFGTGSFTGLRTQRLARLIARSAACRELMLQPLVREVVSLSMRDQCYHPQLSATSAIRIHPGEQAQSLHRDDNVFPFRHPRPPAVIACIWALSEFTADNGATRIVPSSHAWDDVQRPSEEQAISVTMPPGSVLLWDGGLYHGGGGNRSDAARTSVLLAYSLGWLRQYENMYLGVPPQLARTLPAELTSLIGYQNHGFLGTFENDDPRARLDDTDLERLRPPRDLYAPELEQRVLRRF